MAAEQQRPDVAVQRQEWQTIQQLGIDPNRFVFLDETWVKTNMTRLYGRCPVGQRLIEYVPHGHWKTTTFLSALRADGLFAPLVVDGALNGAIFLAWVKQQLAPSLRSGDIVVMDNLAAHKVEGVRQALEAVGASVLYLPPYSPDFNPIEMVFAKIKGEIRQRQPRTKELCDQLCGECLEWFSSAECCNYLRHAGYKSPEWN